MKTGIGFLVIVVCVESVFGQGTINFANLVIVDGVRIVDAPVRLSDGRLLSGSAFAAELYDLSRGEVVALPTFFLTGAEAGYFSGGTLTIGWVLPGGAVNVQVRAWAVSTGSTYDMATFKGSSIGMTIQTGGLNGAPPANLLRLQPFCIGGLDLTCVPEPSMLALLFLGALILGARLRRR